ncbi:tartrate/fumarate subfamily Fe-S type hydro-lyase subunit beta [Escherichia coli]|nr:tartrate/fumarate subfamily Fe-S type hydro-lyase subunit beta [Escherichia coli]
MSNKPFIYQAPFPMGKDNTEYYLLTSDYVSVADFDGETILKVEPEALTLLAQQAFHDASFMLRPAHQKQVCGYSSRSRSQRKRQVRGAAILKKLRNRRQRRAADLPGYRHRDHRR